MRKISYWLIAFVICCTVMDMPAYAVAELTEVSLSASTAAIRKGGETEVLVTAKPHEELYGIEFMIEYDPKALSLAETAGIEYALFESGAASPASGKLYVSAIAKPSAGHAAGKIAKLRFRAMTAGVRTEIKLTTVKGVSRERTIRVQDGQVYPDLKEVALHAAQPLTIRLLTGGGPVAHDEAIFPGQSDIRQEPDALRAAALLTDRLGRPDIGSDIEGWSLLVRDISSRLLTFRPERSGDGSMQIVLNEVLLTPALDAFRLLQEAAKAAAVADAYPYAVAIAADELNRTELRLSSGIRVPIEALELSLELRSKHFTVKLEPERLVYGFSGIAEMAVEPVQRTAERHGITRIDPIGSYRFQFGLPDSSSDSGATVHWRIPDRADSDLAGVYQWNALSEEWTYVREKQRESAGRAITTLLKDGEYGFMLYGKEFADLGSTYAEAAHSIRVLAARGVVSGTGGDLYGVERSVTRAEWTAMLVRAFGLDLDAKSEEAGANAFTDVENEQWHAPYITIAGIQGWIKGYEDGAFRPAKRIARAELAVMLDRIWPDSGSNAADSESGYRDDEDIPVWAKGAVHRMRDLGLLQGDEHRRFRPNEEVSRDDAAVVLLRMIAARGAAPSLN